MFEPTPDPRLRPQKIAPLRDRVLVGIAALAGLIVLTYFAFPRPDGEDRSAQHRHLQERLSRILVEMGVIGQPLKWSEPDEEGIPAAGLRFDTLRGRSDASREILNVLRRQRLNVWVEPAETAPDPIEIHVRRTGATCRLLLLGPREEVGEKKMSVVIDDIGNSLDAGRRLLAVKFPLTFAVLPRTPHGRTLAREAREAGVGVIAHLPMEPEGYPENDPGPGVLLGSMSGTEFLDVLRADLDWLGPIEGANNHMGSRLMTDAAKMRLVMGEMDRRGLYFLDSRTTAETVARTTAIETGVPTLDRSVFLDNERDPAAIEAALREAIRRADRGEPVVVIGHPYPETIDVLERFATDGDWKGVRPVPLGELMPPPNAKLAMRRAG